MRQEQVREAVTEGAALDAREELFAKHITPEPAEEGPPVWTMSEESDDDEEGRRTGADCNATCSGTSDVQRGAMHRTAPGVRRWNLFNDSEKLPPAPHLIVFLSVVSRVGCLVSGPRLRLHVSTS